MFTKILDIIKPPSGELLTYVSRTLQCQQYMACAGFITKAPQKELAHEIEYFARDAKSKKQPNRYRRLCVLYEIIFGKLPRKVDKKLMDSCELEEHENWMMDELRKALKEARCSNPTT